MTTQQAQHKLIADLKDIQNINYNGTNLANARGRSEAYFVGLHNGMEILIATIENRDCTFIGVYKPSLWEKLCWMCLELKLKYLTLPTEEGGNSLWPDSLIGCRYGNFKRDNK